ncbi:MAG: ACT domain-containing protein [Actinomycetota bacterium]
MEHDAPLLVEALAALDPMLLEHEYALLGYGRGSAPPSPEALLAEGFGARIDDPLETTFVVRRPLADAMPPADTRQDGLRVILLTAPLPPDLTGFASTLTGALADRGIPIIPVGTATRDHLIVPEADWPEALAILRGLRDAARQLLEAARQPPPADAL